MDDAKINGVANEFAGIGLVLEVLEKRRCEPCNGPHTRRYRSDRLVRRRRVADVECDVKRNGNDDHDEPDSSLRIFRSKIIDAAIITPD